MTKPLGLTFAVHATSRGFGYVVFEGPFTPYDWGNVVARGNKNAVCLRKLDIMLDRFMPQTLLLEAWGKGTSLRSDRIARLYGALTAMAAGRGIEVLVYGRADIKACFSTMGARTRQEVAEAVARQIDAIGHRLPKTRKPWQSEDRRMALFSAAALVLTHFQFGAARLFDDLSKPS
jgi:Holliday junction resolvasome RuvABC endonuclease subunit